VGAALFYHLTHSGVTEVLGLLIPKALAAGWPVVLRGTDPDRMQALDRALWLAGGDDAFLPHGIAGDPHEAHQPTLLVTSPPGTAPPNHARCLITVDAAPITPAETDTYDRICILFDGSDPTAVAAAREQWKSLTGAGVAAQYWSEASGRWQKQAG
jgi:DNA polymerase-3 subunit chi